MAPGSDVRLLVAGYDEARCRTLTGLLDELGYPSDASADVDLSLAMLDRTEYAGVLVDLELDGARSGLALCARIADSHPDIPVVIVTDQANLDVAIGSIRAGANDFVITPVSKEALGLVVARALRHQQLSDRVIRLQLEYGDSRPIVDLIGTSPAMRDVSSLVRRVASTDVTVLLTGESGTGKELVARAIHSRSRRASGPFVAINCAAVPDPLLESELFGHARGAFTDAKQAHPGLFVQARRGTLFLDEFGEMSPDLQVKLLRVLQERRVLPVGGEQEVAIDTRIVTATNRDLEAEIAAGRFREDLYYRINVVRIHMPPLRARGTDVLALADHFLGRTDAARQRRVSGIAPTAQRILLDYDWPGNVRELENAIEHAVALTRSDAIQIEDLPASVRARRSARIVIDGHNAEHLPTLEEFAERYILKVLGAVSGNKSHASRLLGLDRRTLYRKLERFESARDSD